MEELWESIYYILVVILKVLAVVLVIRVILWICGYDVHFPVIDDIWNSIARFVS